MEFEIGKWYKVNKCWWSKLKEINGENFYPLEVIQADGKYDGNRETPFNYKSGVNSNPILLTDLSEIQAYLPEGHIDLQPKELLNSFIIF